MASELSLFALSGEQNVFCGSLVPWCGAVTARAAPEGFMGRQRCTSALLTQEPWRAVTFEPEQGEWSAWNTGKRRELRHGRAVESGMMLRTGAGLGRAQRRETRGCNVGLFIIVELYSTLHTEKTHD